MPRPGFHSPTYEIPELTREQNAIYGRNLQELELPNPYLRMHGSTGTVSTAGSRVTWDTESTLFPRQGMPPPSTGLTYIRIPFDGLWTVDAGLGWDASTVGRRWMHIVKVAGTGSTGALIIDTLSDAARSGAIRQSVAATVPLYAGDKIALTADPLGTSAVGLANIPYMSISGVGIRGSTF